MIVGLIGAGNMGTAIGSKLLKGGFELIVFDRQPAATRDLCALGAERAESAATLARFVTIVITSLPDPRAVSEVVLTGPDCLVGALRSGSTIVEMSTSTPWLAVEIEAVAKKKSLFSVDAPLVRGGAIIVAGGSTEAFERSRPVLTTLSESLLHVGGAGMGQAMKLVRQYASFAYFQAEAEAILIAKKAGLDIRATADLLGVSIGPSQFRTKYWEAVFSGDFGESGSSAATLHIVAKDIGLAVELARRVGAPAGAGLNLLDTLDRGMAQNWGSNGFWSAVKILEQMGGAQLRAAQAAEAS